MNVTYFVTWIVYFSYFHWKFIKELGIAYIFSDIYPYHIYGGIYTGTLQKIEQLWKRIYFSLYLSEYIS